LCPQQLQLLRSQGGHAACAKEEEAKQPFVASVAAEHFCDYCRREDPVSHGGRTEPL